ncbi:K02A2.6-like [Cordylochernes scorpioides]|uniref:RNA-directed DNA polymerase n=1 Tax=Cordylochernes scorpioides TaxID=51811 RepID=A0ABY6KGX0_9ARAC|nr:K02A2.6-like [Cordylochernes scorpioides]
MVKQIVIPPVLRDTILERCHDSPIGGHLSIEKTLYAVLSHYYWKGAMSDVRRYVKTCPVCAENNGRLKKAPNMPIQPANYHFERLCVDFVGPLTLSRNRNRYLIVFIDAFTRYAEVIPVRDCTAEIAGLEFVNKIVNRYGTCKNILSYRGAAFESDLFREICKLYSIKKLSVEGSGENPHATSRLAAPVWRREPAETGARLFGFGVGCERGQHLRV